MRARPIEQPRHGGQYLAARQSLARHVLLYLAAQLRQRGAECNHAREFIVAAHLLPARVVAVLFAAAGIAPGGLQVPARVRADPDILVGGRDAQARNAGQLGRTPQLLTGGALIDEAAAAASAANARQLVGDVM